MLLQNVDGGFETAQYNLENVGNIRCTLLSPSAFCQSSATFRRLFAVQNAVYFCSSREGNNEWGKRTFPIDISHESISRLQNCVWIFRYLLSAANMATADESRLYSNCQWGSMARFPIRPSVITVLQSLGFRTAHRFRFTFQNQLFPPTTHFLCLVFRDCKLIKTCSSRRRVLCSQNTDFSNSKWQANRRRQSNRIVEHKFGNVSTSCSE